MPARALGIGQGRVEVGPADFAGKNENRAGATHLVFPIVVGFATVLSCLFIAVPLITVQSPHESVLTWQRTDFLLSVLRVLTVARSQARDSAFAETTGTTDRYLGSR